MALGVLEQKLRAVPGVLDCSVSDEGVAVVVHPEVDPRAIELRAQVLLAEAGDRRPLLVVGGMTVGPRVLPSGRLPVPGRRGRRRSSPLSPAAFVVVVLALLAVVPIAGRDAGSSRDRPSPAPAAGGRLPLVDEGDFVAVGPEVPPPPTTAPAPVQLVVVAPAEQPVVVQLAIAEPEQPAASIGKHGKAKGKARVGKATAPPLVPPGHLDPPGRRRGHHR